jgi:hypothetical protein
MGSRLRHIFAVATILVVTAGLGLIGCSKKDSSKQRHTKKQPGSDFQSSLLGGELYPLANGPAYLVGFAGKVFFISGDSATPVKGLENLGIAEVYPLSDGTALLINLAGTASTAMYLLRDDTATPVRETAQARQISLSENYREGFLFVEMSRLRKKVKDLESERDNSPDTGFDESSQDGY